MKRAELGEAKGTRLGPAAGATVSEILADFLGRVRTDGLPQEALAAGQAVLLDCLGGAIAGACRRATQILHQYLRDSSSRGPCTVLGTTLTATAEQAGLVNGLAAHVLDIDDTNSTMDGHPSPAALASSMAAAEAEGRSGRDLVTAFVIGYEVQTKVASLLPRSHWELGWHTAGTLGSLGAASAAAFLFDLDGTQAANAVGAAASMAGGVCSNIGSMVKPMHPGLAARNGILAAELARRGFEAQRQAVDGPFGFAQAFAGSADFVLEAGLLAARLGDPFDIVAPGSDIKLHPTCNYTHAAIDAALDMRSQVMRSSIDRVECRVPSLPPYLLMRFPETRTEGKFSLEYCIALALLHGKLTLEDFDDGPLANADAVNLMRRVRVQVDPTMAEEAVSYGLPAQVTVYFPDGDRAVSTVRAPRGSTANPIAEGETSEKFLALCAPSLSMRQARRLLETVQRLNRLANVRDLRPLLVPA